MKTKKTKFQNMKIFTTRKAWNDMTLIFPILFLFIILGIILPFVNQSFNTTSGVQNVNKLSSDTNSQVVSTTSIGTFTILLSIGKMFLWTFGDINAIIDGIFFVPLRLMLALLLYRQIRSGAG